MRKEKEAKIERIRLEQLAISEEQKRVTQEKAEQKRLRRLVQSNLERIDAAKNYMFPRFISAAAFPKGYNLAQWEKIRVVTLGSTGCGKSSTIATLEKVIRQDLNGASCEIQSAGEEGTVILQEYLSEYNWSILDTRGFWHYGKEDVDEMLALLDGKISAGDYIDRDNNPNYNESAAAAAIDCVVAVAFVIKANDPLLHNQNMMNSLAFMRNHLRKQGLSPITIVTHCDLVGFDLRSTLEFASAATGSPRNLVFPIANYLPEDTEPKPDIEKQALDILEAALRTGEQYIRVRSQRDSRPKPAFLNAVPPPVNPVSVNANPQVSAQATKRVFITYESNKAKMFQITANDSLDSFLHKIEVAFDFTSASLFLENVEIDNESFTMIEHNDRLIVSPC